MSAWEQAFETPKNPAPFEVLSQDTNQDAQIIPFPGVETDLFAGFPEQVLDVLGICGELQSPRIAIDYIDEKVASTDQLATRVSLCKLKDYITDAKSVDVGIFNFFTEHYQAEAAEPKKLSIMELRPTKPEGFAEQLWLSLPPPSFVEGDIPTLPPVHSANSDSEKSGMLPFPVSKKYSHVIEIDGHLVGVPRGKIGILWALTALPRRTAGLSATEDSGRILSHILGAEPDNELIVRRLFEEARANIQDARAIERGQVAGRGRHYRRIVRNKEQPEHMLAMRTRLRELESKLGERI